MRGTAWHSPSALQASVSSSHARAQQTKTPASRAGSQKPLEHCAPAVQVAPPGSKHWPRATQVRRGSAASQTPPPRSGAQRPACSSALHVSQTPAHALSQHTPSTQWPKAQSIGELHAWPRSAVAATHLPSLAHSCPVGQGSLQHARVWPPPTAGWQLPTPHSASSVHVAPGGSRQRPRP